MLSRFPYRKCRGPFWNRILPTILITIGVVFIIFFTPTWVWFFILGILLILLGSSILRKWR